MSDKGRDLEQQPGIEWGQGRCSLGLFLEGTDCQAVCLWHPETWSWERATSDQKGPNPDGVLGCPQRASIVLTQGRRVLSSVSTGGVSEAQRYATTCSEPCSWHWLSSLTSGPSEAHSWLLCSAVFQLRLGTVLSTHLAEPPCKHLH